MKAGIQKNPGEVLIRILAFTLVISSVSAMMFNIVLPQMSAEYQLSYSEASWVTAIYMLIYAVGSVVYGKLADSYKLKNLLTFGLSVFLLGSLVGLCAQAYWMVLAGRALQAVGASVIPATAMLIPVRYFPPETRGRALGISATGLAIGNAIGPILAAFIVSVVHWRWLFCVPFLILFTLPFYRRHLDDQQGNGAPIDWLGGGLLAAAVALLLWSVTMGGWGAAAGSAAAGIAFFIRVRFAQNPFVSLSLLKNKRYALGLIMGMLVMGMGYSLPFLTPQLLAEVNQLEAGVIGFVMVPAAAISAMLGRRAGKLADTKGNAFLFTLASALILLCFLLLSVFVGVSPGFIAGFLIFGTVGQLFMQISLSNSISRALPREQTGVGMGLFSMMGFIAGAVSTGIYSKVVDQGADTHWNPLNGYVNTAVFSNLYLVLGILLLVVLMLYRYSFSREQTTSVS